MRYLLRSYKLLVFLSVLAGCLTVSLIAAHTMASGLNSAVDGMEKKLRGMKLNETDMKLNALDGIIAAYNFPVMQKDGARALLIDTEERFRKHYGARVISPVTENGSAYSIMIEFDFAPETSQELAKLLDYMKNSISPIFYITDMTFKKEKYRRVITVRAELTQPYAGGVYAY